MKKTAIILLALIVFAACKTQAPIDVNAYQFSIYYVSEYCGGAEPPEEVLKDLETPKPLTDSFYIHTADDPERKNASIILDLKKGKASLVGLPVGDYLAFSMPMVEKDSIAELSQYEDCKIETSKMPVFLFKIDGNNRMISDTLLIQCDPCLPPMP